jgi:hypothetical protein
MILQMIITANQPHSEAHLAFSMSVLADVKTQRIPIIKINSGCLFCEPNEPGKTPNAALFNMKARGKHSYHCRING